MPNYLTVNPITGAVGANFSGHVHAQGLDLHVNTDPVIFPPDDSIRWLRQSDGAALANIAGGATNPADTMVLDMDANIGSGSSQALLEMVAERPRPAWPNGYAYLQLLMSTPLAGTKGAIVLDSDGGSDFIRTNRTIAAGLPRGLRVMHAAPAPFNMAAGAAGYTPAAMGISLPGDLVQIYGFLFTHVSPVAHWNFTGPHSFLFPPQIVFNNNSVVQGVAIELFIIYGCT